MKKGCAFVFIDDLKIKNKNDFPHLAFSYFGSGDWKPTIFLAEQQNK